MAVFGRRAWPADQYWKPASERILVAGFGREKKAPTGLLLRSFSCSWVAVARAVHEVANPGHFRVMSTVGIPISPSTLEATQSSLVATSKSIFMRQQLAEDLDCIGFDLLRAIGSQHHQSAEIA
jgi:hypothetical protein